MRLRRQDSSHGSLGTHLDEQCLPEQGQRTEAFDAPEAELGVEQGGG